MASERELEVLRRQSAAAEDAAAVKSAALQSELEMTTYKSRAALDEAVSLKIELQTLRYVICTTCITGVNRRDRDVEDEAGGAET